MAALFPISQTEIINIASQLDEISLDEAGKEFVDKMNTEVVPDIKEIANNFINKMNSYTQDIKNFKEQLKKQRDCRKQIKNNKKGSSDPALSEYKSLQEQTSAFLKSNTVKTMLAEAEKFQIEMNALIGQVVKTIYVYQDEEGNPELYEISGTELLNPSVASRTQNIVGRFRLDNAIKDLDATTANEHIKKLIQSNDYVFNKPNLDEAYKESVWRYQYSKLKKLKLVMWLNQQKEWKMMKVSALGDINEAYATVILLNKIPPDFGWSIVDLNIGDLMTFYVAKVDSESGLLAGDVTIGNIEYAIKSADASMLGIRQMVLLAELIQKDVIKDISDLLKYKQLLHNKARTRNRTVEWTDKQLHSVFSDEVLDYFDKQIEMML